jgi:hypothetical protein
MLAGRRIDQLGGDAQAVAGLSHAALQHVSDAEFGGDLLHVDGAVLVGEARIAGDNEEPRHARQRRNDVLGHAVGEKILVGIVAHIVERQDRDGGLVGQRRACWRTVDVLHSAVAHVLEGEVHAVAHLFVDRRRYADAAGRRQPFEPGRDIDAVAVDVVTVDNHVAKIDADAEGNPAVFRLVAIVLGHGLLDLRGGAHRVDNAREFDQYAVAHQLDRAAVMFRDLRVDQVDPKPSERFDRTFLVGPDKP